MDRYAGQVVSHQQCSGAAKFRPWKSARSGMDERALAHRMDECALTSARSALTSASLGRLRAKAQGCFAMQGMMVRINSAYVQHRSVHA